MIKTNSNWDNKTTVKKGSLGEKIIFDYLQSNGIIVYKPIVDGAHLVDYFGLGRNKTLYSFEVKTKRRRFSMDDTGFEKKHWNEYLFLYMKHSIDIFFFFVDDFEECIYGAWLSHLIGKEKEIAGGYQVVFPLMCMRKIADLPQDILDLLRLHTTENYDYSKTKRFFESKIEKMK